MGDAVGDAVGDAMGDAVGETVVVTGTQIFLGLCTSSGTFSFFPDTFSFFPSSHHIFLSQQNLRQRVHEPKPLRVLGGLDYAKTF